MPVTMKYLPGFLLLLGSWLQPLHLPPWVSWHSEVLCFAAVWWFFGVVVVDKLRKPEPHFMLPLLAVVPLILIGLVTGQYLLGLITFAGDALVIAIYLFTCAVAIFVGSQWELDRNGLHLTQKTELLLNQFCFTVLLGGVASVLIALIQALGVWDWADWIVRFQFARRPGANLGQPNHFATLLVMSGASLAYLYESRKVSRSLCLVAVLLLALGLAIAESRAGLLSAIVLSIWWLQKSRFSGLRDKFLFLGALWAGLVFLVWVWPIFITHIHFDASFDARIRLDSGFRMLMWPQVVEAITQRPFLGWGWGEFAKAHNNVVDHYQNSLPFTYAHNLLLDIALGLGLPLAALCFIAGAVYIFSRLRASSSQTSWYCIAIAIPLAIHSMLEFPYAYAYFLFPVMLALGVLETNLQLNRSFCLTRGPVVLGSSLVLVTMLLLTAEYVVLEEDFRVARFEALRVGSRPADHENSHALLLTQLGAMIQSTRMVIAPAMTKEQINLLENAAKRFPWTALQYRYALALALNANPAEAKRQMQVIKAMNGELQYKRMKENWNDLAASKYPQLRSVALP